MFDINSLFDEGGFSHPFDTDNDPSTLEVDGQRYDLDNPKEAQLALKRTQQKRAALNDGSLDEYEGRGMDMGEGGRTRLLYDELRAKMACDYHTGKHEMTWQEQSEKADEIRGIRAAQLRKQGVL
jgi:hypothetical protein